MQAIVVANLTSKATAGAGAIASSASEIATAEGVDFAALLAAQFMGRNGIALTAMQGNVAAETPLAADVTTKDFKAETALDASATTDPALQAMLMPGLVPLVSVPQAGAEIKQAPSDVNPDKFSGDSNTSAISSLDGGLQLAGDKMSMQDKSSAAEFAVGGKSLPPGDSKNVDGQIADVKAADVKTAGDFKVADVTVADVKAADVKVTNIKVADVKTSDVFSSPATASDASSVVPVINVNHPQATTEVKNPVEVLRPSVGSPGWGDALGQKVVWMSGQNHQVAELHLNPPHLGPMEVRLTINNDQVSALFVSHQPAVREAIEAAMPRLREMFADSGMMLGNAMVSSDSLPQNQNSGQEQRSGRSPQSSADFPLVDGYAMPLTTRGVMSLPGDGRGMVDLFA